ncbi:hypothetical protein [Nostocoides sp. Soil756]|uniref:hypothetical protein n=1 Tax=Nostocoides sp. Soil756 TaxID=1736399 RepID=UPI0006FD8C29|nr:hypothetical protein [Tetrasphaera sp. Soil756]KRE62740.1 hypothetical protein ASG78_07045 [Tetrasphaera sp. Soil756]
MGVLDRFRRHEPTRGERPGGERPAPDDVLEPEPLDEVASRPLTADEESRLEASRLRYAALGIDPADLASIGSAWDAALTRGDETEASEVVTVVAAAIGDHLVGAGYRWVMSTDPFGTDLAVEPPRRGVPVVVRTLVAVRWMKRESGWVEGVAGHLARSARR